MPSLVALPENTENLLVVLPELFLERRGTWPGDFPGAETFPGVIDNSATALELVLVGGEDTLDLTPLTES